MQRAGDTLTFWRKQLKPVGLGWAERLGVLVLGESATVTVLAGITLVLAGVALTPETALGVLVRLAFRMGTHASHTAGKLRKG